jgi:beta-glucosidase
MLRKRKTPKLWRILSGASAAFLAFFIGADTVAMSYTEFINSALSTPSEKIVNDSGEMPYYFESDYGTLEEMLEAKRALYAEISEEGSVLLKNEGAALPLAEKAKVTLLGYGSYDPIYGGMIGSSTTAGGTQTIVSLQEALEANGMEVNPTMVSFYENNATERSMSSVMFGPQYEDLKTAQIGEISADTLVEAGVAQNTDGQIALTADTIGEYTDAAIVVITRRSSEAAEFNISSGTSEDGDSYDSPLDLTTYEKSIIDVAVNSFDKVIVLINSDQAMGIDYIKNMDGVDAILWVGLPGAEGFYGVANVLDGHVNPSGHLVDTYAVHPASAPANANMGLYTWANASVNGGDEKTSTDYGKGDWYVVENEGIYVGYKYYETRYADAVAGDAEALNNANATEYVKGYADYDANAAWSYDTQVSYSFGYGLSYTTFEETLDGITIDAAAGTGIASVTVKNTGSVDGKAVIELYVQSPYTRGGVEKSAIQLVDYGKIDVAAGESVTTEIAFKLENFASYDMNVGQWILDEGTYYFAIGNGAHEALNSVLLAQGTLADALSVSTKEENAGVDKVCTAELSGVDAFLDTLNENVENRLEQADYSNYDPDFNYITRSDWSLGWETVGTTYGDGSNAVSYTEEMEKGLFAELYEITANEKTDDMNFAWDSGAGLLATQFIGVPLDGSIEVDGVTYTYDDLVNCMSLYEACYLLENQYQNLDSVSSINLGECVTNDGPAGFAYDQVPGYAYNWQEYEADDKNYVSEKDENAETSMSAYPTEPVVASTYNKELVEKEGAFMGEDSLWADENLIIGPGTNLHRSPYNARNHEYYSEDSVLTSLTATALCKGAYSKGLMTEAKHFAFNHQEINRIGTATFFNEQSGRENELRCFQNIMENNYTQAIMTSFNRVGTEFAGACEALLVGIARDEWGFEGGVVTDMVNGAMYMNWRDTYAYGLSGCLGTNAYEGTPLGASTSDENLALIAEDSYLQQQIHDAVKYWVYQEVNSNFMNGMDETTQIVSVTPWWQTALKAAIAVFAILTIITVLMFVKSTREWTADKKGGK